MALSAIQKRAYDSEAEDNFRWLSSLLATKPKDYVLTDSDVVDGQHHSQISSIGQYAEMAHGSISPSFVFQHLHELCQPGYPLEEYNSLKHDNARLIKQFHGSVANVQGYAAFRPDTRQLVVAFSGTSSPAQSLKDMQTWRTAYPRDGRRSTVHAGFWRMYQGVRHHAFDALRMGFQEHEVEEVVLTGHSMGCVLCYLLALDLMAEFGRVIPAGVAINLTVFGSPRFGNDSLAKYWRSCLARHRSRFGGASFREYSVKGYNDGVHTLPPCALGFRHLTESPLYFYHGRLYRIRPSECEYGAFTMNIQDFSKGEASPEPSLGKRLEHVAWPRGGHNYYNDRDMEKVLRRMGWLDLTLHGEAGWKDRYMAKLKAWEKKWGGDTEEHTL